MPRVERADTWLATGFAVLVPAGWFLLLATVYWLGWAAGVRRTVNALRAIDAAPTRTATATVPTR